MSATRRFCMFLMLDSSMVDPLDNELFHNDKIDDQLARAIIEISLGDEKKNTASIMHLLSSRFSPETISLLQTQIALFDQTMDIHQEIGALRSSIQKKQSSITRKTKLDEIKQKNMQSLTEDERQFLRNMGRKT